MKIHLRQIPVEGLHLEGVQEEDILGIEDADIQRLGPIRYSLDVGISGSGLFASGTLESDMELRCVRCLEVFKYPLRIDSFAVQVELDGVETVDLTPFMREDILLGLPPHPRCDWNGKKTCRGAGDLEALKNMGEQAAPVTDAWGELDKLKVKTTE